MLWDASHTLGPGALGELIPPSVAGGIVWLGPDQSQYHISLGWFYGLISQKLMKYQKCL